MLSYFLVSTVLDTLFGRDPSVDSHSLSRSQVNMLSISAKHHIFYLVGMEPVVPSE